MKTAAKIIVYCVWFAFLVWFSAFGDEFFFSFAGLVKAKIFGTDISPQIDFAITFIPWNCFISLLIWLPVLFMKQRRLEAAKEIVVGVIFFFFLLATNLLGILTWCVYFPEIIGSFPSQQTFSTLERCALNDGWTRLEFNGVWWMYVLISTALCALATFSVSQMKKQSIYKILSS